MVKFAVFEYAVETILDQVRKSRAGTSDQDVPLSNKEKLAVSLGGGLIAGLAASVASQPGDTILSKINQVRFSGVQSAALYDVLLRSACCMCYCAQCAL